MAGVAGALCAPREMVLLRTHRRQDDGTIIVLYQSTKHRAVRQEQGRWSWYTPVRAQVQAAGFTIGELGGQRGSLASYPPHEVKARLTLAHTVLQRRSCPSTRPVRASPRNAWSRW